MIKAVIFDMDGVIVDSEPIHVLAEKAVCRKYNIELRDSDWLKFKGRTPKDIFQYIIASYHLKNVSVEQLTNDKISFYLQLAAEKIRIFDYAIKLLKYLQKDYNLALTTSSPREIQQFVFEKFNLEPFFKIIVTGDMINQGKPNPEPYLKTIGLLHLEPSDCLVVEDSDNGILAAKNAGARTVAVTHTLPKDKLRAADFIVDNLHQVKEILSILN